MKQKYMDDMMTRQNYVQEQNEKSPFDEGIMKAIESSKKSIAMDKEQRGTALRSGALSFADKMHSLPKVRGLAGNLAQIGMSLSPALQSYDQSENTAQNFNREMMVYAQKLRAEEEAKARGTEQESYNREMKDREFAQKKLEASGKSTKSRDKKSEFIVKQNLEHSAENEKKIRASQKAINAYTQIGKTIQGVVDKHGLAAGSGIINTIAKKILSLEGMDFDQKKYELERFDLFTNLKDMFGSRITNLDLEIFISGLPSLDQPPKTALLELESRKKNLQNNIKELTATNLAVEKRDFETIYHSKIISDEVDLTMNPKKIDFIKEGFPRISIAEDDVEELQKAQADGWTSVDDVVGEAMPDARPQTQSTEDLTPQPIPDFTNQPQLTGQPQPFDQFNPNLNQGVGL